MSPTLILMALVGVVLGVGVGFVAAGIVQRKRDEHELESAHSAAASVMAEAETKAREVVIAAKDAALKARDQAEQENKRRRRELEQEDERLAVRREKLDRRSEQLENRARRLDERDHEVDARQSKLDNFEARQMAELERISGMTRHEAHEELLNSIAQESRNDSARIIRGIEMAAREQGESRAREIVITAIQRCATDVVSEAVTSTVALPSDEVKGRIIGRQGRNIRIFEQITGVDVVVDDTPEAVLISCFDPVRREVARLALTTLIADGRIHPARIEQVVKKKQEELERVMREAGENAAYRAGVHGLHSEIVKLLGRLKYRTSYGQNVLDHSVETADLAAIIAAELGSDVQSARAGGLLHDLGKAVTHETDGPHASVGAEIAGRYGVPPHVVNMIASHHHEVEQESLEAVIVECADAISGSRPGARRESLEMYVKRIKALENVANGFAGVQESYAIQAGREIRIVVRPEEIDDLGALELSRNVAKRVEETLEYPGQVKVTVIREMRAVEFAK